MLRNAQLLKGDVRQFSAVTWFSGLGGNPCISSDCGMVVPGFV